MFIAPPFRCTNFRAVELFMSISEVQDIIEGYSYDIFALNHTYETTLRRTHQAQNGKFSFFNTFFSPKNCNSQHIEQKNIDQHDKIVQYFIFRDS